MQSSVDEVAQMQKSQLALIPQQPTTQTIKQSKASQSQQMPLFWDYLNDQDKEDYLKMRNALSSPACKHRRHHSSELNREIVNTIKNYVIRNDGDDWRRALVSGIVWLPNAIAINTRQLRLLLSKCKSSINALFQNMGYVTIPTTNDYSSSLVSVFPILKDNFNELRKWTIRLVASTQQQFVSKQQQNLLQHRQQQLSAQINANKLQQLPQPSQILPSTDNDNQTNQTESTGEAIPPPSENSNTEVSTNLINCILVKTEEKVDPSTISVNANAPEQSKDE